MSTHRISVTLPTEREIITGLGTEDSAEIAAAREAVDRASRDLADERERLAAACELAEQAPTKVRRGELTASDVRGALDVIRVGECVVAERERSLEQAETALAEATAEARAAVYREARVRLGRLQEEADRVAPVLEEIRALERTMRRMLPADSLTSQERVRLQSRLGAGPLVGSVTWPSSASAEGRVVP